jgi:integrase
MNMARSRKNRKSARRPYGWGSFRQLSSGTYELYYSLDGKRVTEYVATAAEAERRLEEVRRAKEDGRAAELAGYPFRALCDRFLRAKGSEGLEPVTLRGYHDIIRNHFLPVFGDAVVSELTYEVIEDYRTIKLRGATDANGQPWPNAPVAGAARPKLSPQSVRNHLELLHQLLDYAVRLGYLTRNPAKGLPRPQVKRGNVRAYETDEALDILELLPGDTRMLGELLLATGCRLGEALALRRSDCGEVRGAWGILVRRSLKRVGGRDVVGEYGKTHHAYRFLAASDALRAALEAHLAATAHYPDRDGDPFVFRSPSSGGHLNPANFRNRAWLPAVGTAYLRRLQTVKLGSLLEPLPPAHAALAALLAAVPGLSLQEARRLTRDAYDPSAHVLHYVDVFGDAVSVKLDGALHDRLVSHLLDTARLPNKRRLIFPGAKGMPFSVESFTKAVFRDGFTAAGLDPMTRVHNLRHTYACSQIEGLVDDSALAYRMAHASPAFTRSVYGHVRESVRRQVADIYDLTRRS